MSNLTPLRQIALLLTTAMTCLADPITTVSIVGEQFHLNGRPTYEGRTWRGYSIEGLLMNARLVQGVFDDLNPATVDRWAYPDTGRWDPERNTREFLAAMPAWRRHGLLGFTINFQGGSPEGYSRSQPWENNAYTPEGALRPDFADRMERVIDFADQLGMVVILGYFYFGQDQRLADEAAILRAVDETTAWVLDRGWRNVVIEINNECDVSAYDHAILKADRIHELITRAQGITLDGRRLLVSTSFKGNSIPTPAVVAAADFILIHGNGVDKPARLVEMVEQTRALPTFTPKPIVFNEDDHFSFDLPHNHFTAAVSAGAGWGYFDFRMKDEGFDAGFQSVPVNWGISSERKRGFFRLLAEITGSTPDQP